MAKNFNSVLTLQKEESIYSIMGRMDTLIDFFTLKKNFSKHLPFLKTYYLVTRRVSEKNVENSSYYENKKNLERLDILFASFTFLLLKIILFQRLKELLGKHIILIWKKSLNLSFHFYWVSMPILMLICVLLW